MPMHDQPIGEFDLIAKFFSRAHSEKNKNVLLGVGDDCALLTPRPPGSSLAITTDMLIEERHFFSDVHPAHLGHKALAVNLSDLAAIGATPLAFTLGLALPSNKANHLLWLEQFSNGLYELANLHECTLIGGDTTEGPLTISITALGEVPPDQALRRNCAQVEDDIWVSHQLGDARWALGHLRKEWRIPQEALDAAILRLEKPTPRIELGVRLRSLAHAAIDISDGLLGDLMHILKASNVNADVWIDTVPVSKELNNQSIELRRLCALRGGDDYELCFTTPKHQRADIEKLSQELAISLTRIGVITASSRSSPSMRLLDESGLALNEELTQQYLKSFDHFK